MLFTSWVHRGGVGALSAIGLAVIAANGCGGTTESGSGRPSVSQSELPGALAQAICQNLGSCCQGAGLPLDPSKCAIVLSQAYKSLLPDTDGGTYDAAASGPCIEAASNAARQCQLDGTSPSSAACSPLFQGSSARGKAAGDPCDETCSRSGSSVSCSGFVSSGSGGGAAASGTCYTNDGLYCDHTTSVCKNQVAAGGPCTYDEECNKGWCATTCNPLLPEGGNCGFGNSNRCVEGLHCDGVSGLCAKPVPEGAPCQFSSDCEKGRCRNQVCDASESSRTFLTLACAG